MTVQDKERLLKSIDQVVELIDNIKNESFPELSNIKIQLSTFESDFAFLTSRPITYSLFLPFKVKYKIGINRKLFTFKLPLFALEGILAHELAHTSFYVVKGRLRTIFTGVAILHHHENIEFERRTDIDAITRGYGEGIKAYREVLYRELSDEQIAKKNERYFSPEEIDALVAAYADYPELRDIWLRNPPLDLVSIHSGVADYIAKRDPEKQQGHVA